MMSRLVPKLRFKEFSGEWEEVELKSLGKFKGGGTPSKQKSEYWIGNIPWISSSDINKDNIDYINISKFINEKSIKESATKIIPKNSVLFVSRVGVGKLAINKQELCTSQDFTNFIPNEINSHYLGYFFIANKNLLDTFNQGTSIKGFTKSDLETLKIKIPKPPEQQKIANCLSSLDNLIESQNKKVEALEKHKKGLMQGLFPREGESVPRLRFEEFFGEWEEKELKSVAIVNMGQSPASSSYNIESKGIHLIQGNADIKNRMSNPRQWTIEPTKLCSIGDLILTVRAPVGHIAKSRHNACIGRGVCSIMKKENNNLEFIYQFLLSYEKKWVSLEQGSTFTAVSGNDIKSLKLTIAKPKEQQKIANCLSSLDNLIEAQNKKIAALKQHKKGLMQGMFVSGEVDA